MVRILRAAALGLAVGAFAVACAKVPQTGRTQFNFVPDDVMNSLGKQTFVQVVREEKVERNTRDANLLKKVGTAIARTANEPDYEWRFALIDSDQANAWCLPGGYVGLYTGILPVLRNEAGLAFVTGHEVGHATARHAAERLSQQLAVVGGLTGVNAYLSGREGTSDRDRQLIVGALGLGAQFGVLLPFSRTHESEADLIGMMSMARAGYPPTESIKVWDRMSNAGGARPPEFLSTHPSHETRQSDLREWMPRASKRYDRNRLGYDTTKPLWGGGRAVSRNGTEAGQ